jgi:hypothetical protein
VVAKRRTIPDLAPVHTCLCESRDLGPLQVKYAHIATASQKQPGVAGCFFQKQDFLGYIGVGIDVSWTMIAGEKAE